MKYIVIILLSIHEKKWGGSNKKNPPPPPLYQSLSQNIWPSLATTGYKKIEIITWCDYLQIVKIHVCGTNKIDISLAVISQCLEIHIYKRK